MSYTRISAAVDLGKSRCRVALRAGESVVIHDGVGSPGLATSAGVDAALAAILPLLTQPDTTFDLIGVGAAGAWAAPDSAAALAHRLSAATSAPVAVASDVVTAHAGALGGREGVLLIAGTGAAALGVDADGARLIDGWGPDLGDFGSGSWLGREGVRATLRAANGLGPQTRLTDVVGAHIIPATDPISWLSQDAPTARLLATAAPLVLDAAEAGDAVATAIVAQATGLLTASAVAASARTDRVTLHGGLTDHPWFRARLEQALVEAGRALAAPAGDAFDGALLLARSRDLPHERFVHRAA